MKKNMFLLLCALALVSCEQEDVKFEFQTGSNENEFPLTRSASDVPAAIDQLDGIPVNIKSAYSKKYLSVISDDGEVALSNDDDGSLRQRWFLKEDLTSLYPYKIIPLYRFDKFNNPMIVIGHYKGGQYGPFVNETIINQGVFRISNFDSFGFYFGTMQEGGLPPIGTPIDPLRMKIYMQPVNMNSNELVIDDNYYKGDQVKWEIIPVDEFRIEDITYDLTKSDQLSVIPVQIANKTLVNDTDLPATRVISFQETVTNESSFSDTEELKVNVSTSTSAKIGLASFIEGNFSMSASVDKTWSYTVGGKESKSYAISESITQEIPPRTTIKAELVATKYDADLTYIAKMYGINTGKTIYLKGKWKGVVVQESKIVLTQKDKILKMIKVTPKQVDVL